MKLRSFSVQGFKNFVEEVRLDDLGDINVIHGENNVGKSNILQAIDLFCRGVMLADFHKPNQWMKLGAVTSQHLGFPSADVFNRTRHLPPHIELCGEMLLSEQGEDSGNHKRITAKLRLEPISSPKRADGYVASIWADQTFENNVHHWRSVSHALIGIDRRRHGQPPAPPSEAGKAAPVDRELMPADLCLQLHDAQQDRDPEIYLPWKLFDEAMGAFQDLLGPGTWLPLYDRKLGRAFLAFETKETRYSLHLLGSGVQQVAALLANILLARTSMVSIEEPEGNLRYSLQHRLREVLRRIVGRPGGPSQIFLTSHSPAFEAAEGHFYWLRKTDKGPVVERRPASEARRYTEQDLDAPPPGERAPLSYLTSDGLVEVPEDIRARLGLPNGGGVVFIERKDSGHVEMLTNEQYLKLFEPDPADAAKSDA